MSLNKEKTIRRWSLLLSLCGLLVVVAGWALSDHEASAESAPAHSAEVLAMVGGQPITEADVEAGLSSELLELKRRRYTLLEQGLGRLVSDKLIELEAASRDMTVDELMAAEVQSKIGEVTDGEVDAFYQARQGQINRPKEEVAGQIRSYLASQRSQEALGALVATLEEKYAVEKYLDPLRIDVSTAGSPSDGPDGAPVKIVEFSDFQCPYCSRVIPTLDKVKETYGEKVQIVFRQFPLSIHPEAWKAAEASLCAHDQGKFWEMHDLLFEEQRQLSIDQLKAKAQRLELDTEVFAACLDSDKYNDKVQTDFQEGQAAGVTGTPAMFVNGRFISGAVPYESIAVIIDEELASAN